MSTEEKRDAGGSAKAAEIKAKGSERKASPIPEQTETAETQPATEPVEDASAPGHTSDPSVGAGEPVYGTLDYDKGAGGTPLVTETTDTTDAPGEETTGSDNMETDVPAE